MELGDEGGEEGGWDAQRGAPDIGVGGVDPRAGALRDRKRRAVGRYEHRLADATAVRRREVVWRRMVEGMLALCDVVGPGGFVEQDLCGGCGAE